VIAGVTVANGANATPLDILLDAPTTDTLTVIRLVGSLQLYPNTFTTNTDGAQRVDFGIGVASKEAFTAGIVPDPAAGNEYPALGWLWAHTAAVLQAGVVTNNFNVWPYIGFDIGAMRKIDKGILYLTWDNNNLSGTSFTVSLSGRIRALCLT